MSEFEIGPRRYRARLLSLMDQWRLLRLVDELLPAIKSTSAALMFRGLVEKRDLIALMRPLTQAPEDKLREVIDLSATACEVGSDDGWKPVLMDELSMADLIHLIGAVVDKNLGPLFAMKRPTFTRSLGAINYDPVRMPDGEDWLWRPVGKLCKAESLFDGTLRIEHIAKMNDVLDCEDENQMRARRAAEAAAKR